jgi:hypothetical protein
MSLANSGYKIEQEYYLKRPTLCKNLIFQNIQFEHDVLGFLIYHRVHFIHNLFRILHYISMKKIFHLNLGTKEKHQLLPPTSP